MEVDEDDEINSKEDEGFVMIANELLDKCNIKRKVSCLTECSDAFFIAVYQGLLGDDLKGIIKNPITREDRAKNCQSVIDALASEVLDVDLCHIVGNKVVCGDRSSIRNLLEIFAGLLEYFLECAEGNFDERSIKDADDDDSNLLTAEHHIISGVLREELGSPYKHTPNTQINRSGDTQPRSDQVKTGTYTQLPGTEAARGHQGRVDTIRTVAQPNPPHVCQSDTQRAERDSGLHTSTKSQRLLPTPLSRQTGSSTDTDTSKVSDSTAELIRLGETSSSSTSSKYLQGKRENATPVVDSGGPQVCLSSDMAPSRHSLADKPTSHTSGMDIPVQTVVLGHDLSRSEALVGRSTDAEPAELTQYTLESSSKQDPHVSSSFLSGSSVSASWSELISPLDPVRDGSNGLSGFESLGVRPRSQPQQGSRIEPVNSQAKAIPPAPTKEEGAASSDGSTVHHYHHHFHHGVRPVPGPSAAAESTGRDFREQATASAVSALGLVSGPHPTSVGSASAALNSQSSSQITAGSSQLSLEPSSSLGQQTFDRLQPRWAERVGSSFQTSHLGPSDKSQENWKSSSGKGSSTAPVPPPVRRETAAELLAKYRKGQPVGEAVGSSSEDEGEGEDLAQLSDSVVDYSAERDEHAGLWTSGTLRLPSQRGERVLKTSSRRPQRGVTFNDDVETIPVTSRMDRLRRLLDEEERDQRKQQADAMRTAYREQLRDLQREQKKARQPKRKDANSPGARGARKKRKPVAPPRGRLEAIYRPHSRRPQKPAAPGRGARKRSASASPVMRRRHTSPDRHLDVFGAKDALLPAMFEDFPFLHVSPQTAHNMWTKQARQLSALMKSDSQHKQTKTQQLLKDAERRQEALAAILNKELEHGQRLREQRERQEQERAVRHKLREKRHVTARARRYFYDYQLRMRSKMLKRRTREEQIFKKLFEDGLEIQKERIRELRQYAKEKREAHAQRQQNEIQSMENYYRDQFSMLAESIARERCDMEVRENAQDKVMRQMRRELRHKMEREIQEFQENLTRDEDSAYFRQLEADRLRRQFQLAAYNAHF